MSDDAKVRVVADLSDFKHEFALANQFADEKLKATARNAKKEFAGAGADVGKFGKGLAELAGGPATRAAKALEVFGGAVGGAGAAGAAAAVGIAALAYGVVEIGDAAIAAEERLIKAGQAARIDQEARESVEAYSSALTTLRNEVDLATVEVAGPFTGSLEQATLVLSTMAGRIDDVVEHITGGFDRAAGAAKALGTALEEGMAATLNPKTIAASKGAFELLATPFRALGEVWEENVRQGEQLQQIQEQQAEGAKVAEDHAKMQAKLMQERAEAERKLAEEGKRRDDAAAAKAARELAEASREAAAAERERADAAAEVNRGLAEQRRAQDQAADAAAALLGMQRDATDDVISDEERLRRAYEERVAKIRELGAESQNWERMNVTLREEELRLNRDLAALDEQRAAEQAAAQSAARADLRAMAEEQARVREGFYEWSESFRLLDEEWAKLDFEAKIGSLLDGIGAMGDAAAGLLDARVQGLQDQITAARDASDKAVAQWQAQREAEVQAALEAGTLTQEQADAKLQAIDEEARARRRATERQLKDEKAALMRSWEASKKVQLAAAAIEAIRAGIALIPAFAFLGPGAPAAAAAVAAAGFAAAATQIGAQQPPELPTGRTPDHTAFAGGGERTREDELVANPRATAEILRRLNGSGNLGEGPMVIELVWNQRVLARAIREHERGSLRLRPASAMRGLGVGRSRSR